MFFSCNVYIIGLSLRFSGFTDRLAHYTSYTSTLGNISLENAIRKTHFGNMTLKKLKIFLNVINNGNETPDQIVCLRTDSHTETGSASLNINDVKVN